jgi:hypothetical protein
MTRTETTGKRQTGRSRTPGPSRRIAWPGGCSYALATAVGGGQRDSLRLEDNNGTASHEFRWL